MARPFEPAEDADEAEAPPRGVGEGVTFTAFDDFISGGSKVFHEPKAVENRSVKFFYIPREGAYACAPFADYEGDVAGAIGFDTLGLYRAFSAAELEMLESLAVRTGETLQRIEAGLAEHHHALMEVLSAAYPKSEEGAYPAFTPEEGADPIESAKSAVAIPAAVLAPLDADAVKHLETRRSVAPAMLLALKGAIALTSPAIAPELGEATWDGIKEGITVGEVKWGAELFAGLGAFDVMEGAGGEGWAVAMQMAAQLSEVPEEGAAPKDALTADPALLLGKVLCDWLLAVCDLHSKKVEKEEAEAAAAEEAAAAAAAAAAEAEAYPAEAAEEAQE